MARLTPITGKDQVAPKDQAIVDSIVASRGALQGPFTMFLHCPELAGRLAHLGAFVRFEGSLDMRVRVLAAMTVAREFEAIYVWGADHAREHLAHLGGSDGDEGQCVTWREVSSPVIAIQKTPGTCRGFFYGIAVSGARALPIDSTESGSGSTA